jgi:hypothetical protein
MVKRKLKRAWTCSDFTHHEHRWKWSASLCGMVQHVTAWFLRRIFGEV